MATITWTTVREALAAAGAAEAARGEEVYSCDHCDTAVPEEFDAMHGGDRSIGGLLTAVPTTCTVCDSEYLRHTRPEDLLAWVQGWLEA